MGRYAALRRLIKPICSSDEEMEKYVQAWKQPGAITGMLCYYRAAFRRVIKGSLKRTLQSVQPPTLLIWGEKDPALDIALTQSLDQWAPNLRVERLAQAGHFVQNESPQQVNDLLLAFLLPCRS
jgi:pimeloyl-ACP methyl ester carboxylesterase